MDDYVVIVAHFTGLFIASSVFAGVLSLKRVRNWYKTHNKTWFMVVVGAMLILSDVGSMVLFGVAEQRTWSLTVLACCVCGAPIVHMERTQDAKEAGALEATQHTEGSKP